MPQRKLNFLLVAPRVIQSAGDGYAFPLGIAYVSAMLKAQGYRVFTSNLNHAAGEQKALLAGLIEAHDIDVVATGGLSFQYSTLLDIVRSAKEIKPTITTVVGGGIITAEPEVALLALEYADFGVVGEGEYTMCELAEALEQGLDVSRVKGIVYRRGGMCLATPPRKEIDDLDALPWPDYEGFELGHYLTLPSVSINNMITKRMVYMAASRSCPFSCTFCFHSTGRKYRIRSLENVFAEVAFLKSKYDIGFAYMVDELFTVKKERLFAFAEKMTEFDIPWTASFRVNDIDDELVRGIKGSNCAGMMFGLESADNRILKSMRKKTTIEQVERALKLAYDAGIPTAGNFIFGDVAETAETAATTLDWWERHTEYNIGLNLINTYPGSSIYKYACERKLITDRVQFLKDGCPQINISQLSAAEMAWLTQRIFSAPYTTGKRVADVHLQRVLPSGHISFTGRCSACGKVNSWEDIKLFVGNSWVPCKYCGQKHNAPLPESVMRSVELNIAELLNGQERIAMWGLTYYSLDLFMALDVFRDERIVFVDNSAAKQKLRVHGRPVHPPSVLNHEEIRTVVVFYPNSISQVASIIERDYPTVTQVIDVCTLICEHDRPCPQNTAVAEPRRSSASGGVLLHPE